MCNLTKRPNLIAGRVPRVSLLRPVAMTYLPKEGMMKVSTNQTGRTIDRGRRATRDIRPARAKPMTGYCFERRFCGVLIALIFTTVAVASVVLIHLPAVPLRGLTIL
jgi:hypothetical protein